MSIVIDTSVYIDRFVKDAERKSNAKVILEYVSQLTVVAPKIFLIELECVMARKTSSFQNYLDELAKKLVLIPEENLFLIAHQMASKIHGRAVDLYFISAAQLTESILITNDKRQHENALLAGIESYYLMIEFTKAIKCIKELINKI